MAPNGVGELREQHVVPLRKEVQADEWHFEGERHQTLVQHEEIKGKDFRSREAEAMRRQKAAEDEAEQHIEALLRESEQYDAQCAAEIRQMREEIHRLNSCQEEEKEACNEDLVKLEEAIRQDREHAAKLQGLIWEEKKISQRLHSQIDEIEDKKWEELKKRDREIERIRIEAQDEVYKVQRAAEQNVLMLEHELEEQLHVLHGQIDQTQKQCQGTVQVEIEQKRTVVKQLEAHVSVVDASIAAEIRETGESVVQMANSCEERILEVQRRDFEKEDFLKEKINVMLDQFEHAEVQTDKARMLEEHHKKRVTDCVNVLGHHFPPSTQYSPIFDKKMKSALHVIAND